MVERDFDVESDFDGVWATMAFGTKTSNKQNSTAKCCCSEILSRLLMLLFFLQDGFFSFCTENDDCLRKKLNFLLFSYEVY